MTLCYVLNALFLIIFFIFLVSNRFFFVGSFAWKSRSSFIFLKYYDLPICNTNFHQLLYTTLTTQSTLSRSLTHQIHRFSTIDYFLLHKLYLMANISFYFWGGPPFLPNSLFAIPIFFKWYPCTFPMLKSILKFGKSISSKNKCAYYPTTLNFHDN